MLAKSKRGGCRDSMRVIGCADDNRVNVLLFQELSEIAIGFCSGKFLFGRAKERFVDVAKRHDVLGFDATEILGRTMSRADDADIQFFVSGETTRRSRTCMTDTEESAGSGEGSGLEELAAAHWEAFSTQCSDADRAGMDTSAQRSTVHWITELWRVCKELRQPVISDR